MSDAIDTQDREPAHDESAPHASSIRPVIQHALTDYYGGNAELARTLIDRLLAEDRSQ